MAQLPIRATAMCWYRREDYARIRRIMVDGHKLPATFDAWLKGAQKGIEHLDQKGIVTVKAYLDPTEFAGWCAERGLNLDANARMQYATWVALQAHGRTH